MLTPAQYEPIPGAAELGAGRNVAIAPFRFDGGRIGFLVALNSGFDELKLKILAGLADQAKLAIANAR